jgi:transposase
VLIDHTNGRVLDVLETRDKQALVQWLREGKESGLLSSLEEVTCDMWGAYPQAIDEVFGPSIRVTVDRFHVMKHFQEQLADARRELQRGIGREQSKLLKGSRFLWRTNPENLTPEQRGQLQTLKQKFPMLGKLADHREALRAIFEDRSITTAAAAIGRLRQWCNAGSELGLYAVNQFNKTLTRWMDEIANYFVSRSSNGRTEGFNRGLRSILWRACGMQNFTHFRLRVLHQFG